MNYRRKLSSKVAMVTALVVLAALMIALVAIPAGALNKAPLLHSGGDVLNAPDPAIPTLINYQGTLFDPATGNPVADGQYQFVFSIYDSATGGTQLWQETQQVTVENGLFSVLLGNQTALSASLFEGSPRYLGIKVGADAEMTPRQLLASVPYAFQAENADTLDGMDSTQFMRSDTDSGTSGSLSVGGTLTASDVSVSGYGQVINAAGQWVGDPAGLGYNPLQIALLRWYEANQTGITFSVGTNPYAIAFDGANIWVTNEGSDNVTKLKASDGTVLGTYSVGDSPRDICFDGQNIWVANSGNINVTKLRASDGSLVGTYTVGTWPMGICFDGQNIWVANEGSANVTKLKASDGSLVGTYSVGTQPERICFDGQNIWVTHWGSNNVIKLKASDGTVLGTYSVGSGPYDICFDGANIWVANVGSDNVTKLKASDGSLVGTYSVGTNPYGICFDGANIWVANYSDNNVTKLRASDGENLGTFPVGDTPLGICFDGFNIWVTNSGNNDVSKL